MKTLIILCLLLIGILHISSCATRQVFYTKNCDTSIPNYDTTKWEDFNDNIIKKYRGFKSKPKILGGANGIIIYKSLPKDQQIVEDMICEYWRKKYEKR